MEVAESGGATEKQVARWIADSLDGRAKPLLQAQTTAYDLLRRARERNHVSHGRVPFSE
jgi:hypothetical protein